MENAAEALKIAFSVIMFVLALSLGISSFSEANRAVQEITTQRDRETEYTYVQPSATFTRIVGVETIIPTMYQAYRENIAIYFLDENENPLPLYYKTNPHDGTLVKDASGRPIEVNYIDLSLESYGMGTEKNASELAIEHLGILLDGLSKANGTIYEKQILHSQGLYYYLKDLKFEERLGEYNQGEGASQIKKRVITYKLLP